MPLDPIVRRRVAHLRGRSFSDLLRGRVPSPEPVPTEEVAGVEARDVEVDGPHGPIPVRVYVAADRPDDAPALVWCHGGGWMAGDLDMAEADAVSRRVARSISGVVVSVAYRLAPAHTYPVPLDDVVAAFEATAAGPLAREHALAPHRIALGGASAGGNLAASAALVLAARSPRRPAALLLAYPATSPVDGPWPREARPEECPKLLWLDERRTPGLFSLYLGGAAPGPPAVPAAGDLSVLPPTLVTTAEYDALTPQAVRFAELARAAGVDVEVQGARGTLHGYLDMVGSGVAVADAALASHVEWLRRHLA